MKKSPGFQLIELIITLSIVSILIAISFPLYTRHLVEAKRLEAANTLSQLAIAIEQYQLIHQTYEQASLDALGFPEFIAKGNYQLKIEAQDQDYLLLAIPLGSQAENDMICSTLTLNAEGEKGIRGMGKVEDCW